VWGRAKVYSRTDSPAAFQKALEKMDIMRSIEKLGLTELPPDFNYRIIEITPDKMRYGNLREGVYHVTWERK